LPSSRPTLPEGDHQFTAPLRIGVELVAVMTMVLVLLGLACIFLLIVYEGYRANRWISIFERQFLAIIGVPTATFGSVAIVQFFRGFHGPIEFSFGSSKFSGATGPVILWLFCFATFILGMRYLWQS
jgi:hypothetical protein